MISRDHNAAQEIYNSLLTRYGEAQISESMETDKSGERFRIMEAAIPPTDPSAPNRVRLLMMGFIRRHNSLTRADLALSVRAIGTSRVIS